MRRKPGWSAQLSVVIRRPIRSPWGENHLEPVDEDAVVVWAETTSNPVQQWWQTTALFIVVVGVRLSFALQNRVPSLAHDEHAQIAIARYVGGQGRWNMADYATWQPGLGILAAPLAAFFSDPSAMYRSVLVVNCLLGGGGALVLAALGRRMLRPSLVTHGWVCFTAGLIALSPGSVRSSALAWADPAVFLTFALTLYGLIRFGAVDGERRWAFTAVAIATVGYLFHARMLPVLAIATVAAVAIAWRRRRVLAAQLVVVSAVGMLTVRLVSSIIFDALWADPSAANTAGSTASRLGRPGDVLISAAGQTWYLLVTTLGLAGVGAVVLGGAAVNRPWATEIVGRRNAVLVAVPTAVSAAVSMVFMAGRDSRADFAFYGRYNDAVIGATLLVGVAAISVWSSSRRRLLGVTLGAVAAGAAGTGAALQIWRGDLIATRSVTRLMVTGLAPFVYGPPRNIVLITLASGILIAVLVTGMVRFGSRSWLVATIAVVLVGTGALRIADVFDGSGDAYALTEVVSEVDSIVPEGEALGMELSLDGDEVVVPDFITERVALSNFQFFLPDHEFITVFPGDPVPDYTFAWIDSERLEGLDAEVVWSDESMSLVLWHVFGGSDCTERCPVHADACRCVH